MFKGEYNDKVEVRKQMRLEKDWWSRTPSMKIHVSEYQLLDLFPLTKTKTLKKKFLCKSIFHFYQDSDEGRVLFTFRPN